MDDKIFDQIQEVDIKKTMEESYIDYAMSVIASRALPDARDGLKPVQRRVLYSTLELNAGPDKPHRKCARIVGETMGKYHPHGDSSIYGALVNMAQDWNFRYTLIDGHGNFGSVDGDGAAAMRYTEARLSKISVEMLADIGKNTVDFIPNFDETEKEPVVLPSRFPNLLVNGTTGIAVGMATNIPPHNLREVISAVVKIIDNRVEESRETSIDEIMQIVKGPDFPTGGVIMGHSGIEEAYRTGRGKIRTRALTEIETLPSGKSRIVVTELPYMVNKARLIEKIAELVRDKKVEGITGITDESSREGLRVTIDVRHDANANVILNRLYKHTQLQDTFGVNMLALVNNKPKTMNILEILTNYLAHQEDVVTRRTQYDLNKAEERAHILQGLLIALDHIDEVIQIIRGSANTPEAKANLIARFGLSEAQAQAIVDMRLRALTGLEREKLEAEYAELMDRIAYLKGILADNNKLLGVIREEILEISERFGDDRRTGIDMDAQDLSNEDLIPNDKVVIAMSKLGYIKRMTNDTFRAQGRGGKGIRGMQTIDNDDVSTILTASSHDYMLFFTNRGRMYRMKTWEIPEAGRNSRGTALINLLELMPEEKVTIVITSPEIPENAQLVMATRQGYIKRTALEEYDNIRRKGLIAISLREEDELIDVKITSGNQDILLFTKKGMSIRFNETDARSMGRNSMGVMGIRLDEGDCVQSMVISGEGEYILSLSEKGLGKRTPLDKFNVQTRGGKGLKSYRITEKTGDVLGVLGVEAEDEIIMINTEGIVIRTGCSDISVLDRITSGVRVMSLKEDQKVASLTKALPMDELEGDGEVEDSMEDAASAENEMDESDDRSEEMQADAGEDSVDQAQENE